MFGEETEGRFVPLSDRSALLIPHSQFLSPSCLCTSSSLNPTFQFPRPPAPSWSSRKPPHLRDAIASLPLPPAHPCSRGKKSVFFFFYHNTTDRLEYTDSRLSRAAMEQQENTQMKCLRSPQQSTNYFKLTSRNWINFRICLLEFCFCCIECVI